jgi:hypothetical protein
MSEENKQFSNRPNIDPQDYYLSEEGYIIFTESYHLKRGYCCQNSCKHCPYGFNKKAKAYKKD